MSKKFLHKYTFLSVVSVGIILLLSLGTIFVANRVLNVSVDKTKASEINANLPVPLSITLTGLDSSIRANWAPATDPAIAWQIFSIWDGNTLVGTKVLSKTANAADGNGLEQNHNYTIKIQTMDANGALSNPVSAVGATDTQSPMANAAFFENFNDTGRGDLNANVFDVRTKANDNAQPDSIADDRLMVFNSERHFHTQLIGGLGRTEIQIRPRQMFDFTNRTGTIEFEVDFSAVHTQSNGKWLEVHVVQDVPGSGRALGAGNGNFYPNNISFSMSSPESCPYDTHCIDNNTVNFGHITVTDGSQNHVVKDVTGNIKILTPTNVRVPVVIRLSQTDAEMFVNGVSVVRATGINLPFTRGHVLFNHRGFYTVRNEYTQVAQQLIHWETIQFDGPPGTSYNPVIKTYYQQDVNGQSCSGLVNYGNGLSTGIRHCPIIPVSGNTANTTINIPDPITHIAKARLLYNFTGAHPSTRTFSINGHSFNVDEKIQEDDDYQANLTMFDIPTGTLQTGDNQIIFNVSTSGSANRDISQVEIETDTTDVRQIGNPALTYPNALAVTSNNFIVHPKPGDPQLQTRTTYIYLTNGSGPVNWTATVNSTETPWLTVSPASGTISAIPLPSGGSLVPINVNLNLANVTTNDEGVLGTVKVQGAGMAQMITFLVINDHYVPVPTSTPGPDVTQYPPKFEYAFTANTTTFNKNAIPGYHGAGGTSTPTPIISISPSITPIPPTPSRFPTSTPFPTPTGSLTNVWMGNYYNNTTWSGTPILIRSDSNTLAYDWGFNSPGPGVQADNFSVRWTKADVFQAGNYLFSATVDDTLDLFIDSIRVKRFAYSANQQTYTKCMTAGTHNLRADFKDLTEEAVARLSYIRTGSCSVSGTPAPTIPPTIQPTPTRIPTNGVTPTTPPSAGALPWLKTSGNQIQRADTNQRVELRGGNLLSDEWAGGDMTFVRQAIPFMASDWHANLVTHGFASTPVVNNDATYLSNLDEYQRLAEQNHMYIIFCYYYQQIDGDQPEKPNDDPNAQTALVRLAQRYSTKSNVLFMLQAEPHSGNARVTWNTLRPIYDTMISAIRAVDPNKHLILASGDGYGRDISPVVTDEYGVGHVDPITADNGRNIVYSSHPYDPPSEWGYFLPVYDGGYPVLVTEFGTGGQMSQSDVDTLMTTLNSGGRHISWTAWTFDNIGPPTLLSSRSPITPSNPYGVSVRQKMISEATRF